MCVASDAALARAAIDCWFVAEWLLQVAPGAGVQKYALESVQFYNRPPATTIQISPLFHILTGTSIPHFRTLSIVMNSESTASVQVTTEYCSMTRFVKPLGVAVSIAAVLVAIRIVLEPRMGPLNVVNVPANERPHVKQALVASVVDRSALLAELGTKRVLLIGEEHFEQEPQAWLQTLLDDLHATDGRAAVLLLELPQHIQPQVDAYLATGDEAALDEAFIGSDVLPYKSTVRWARAHRGAVTAIRVDDENFWHVGLMRLLLTDTRNATMARAIAAAAQAYPGQRIVAYGGRMHMMNAGRYMYDSNTRRPTGARLPALGIAKKDIAAVWLFAGEAPVDGLWDTPNAVTFAGPAGDLLITKLEDNPIFGVVRLKEVADYAVQLGPATPIKR